MENNQKICIKCNLLLHLEEYYKHSKMSDGHLNKCKKCCKKEQKTTRDSNVEYYRNYDKERNKTAERKLTFKEKLIRMRSDHPGMMKAHNAVSRALKNGSLIRPEKCSRCEYTEHIQGHHDDYSKVLEVIWLCPTCHANRHFELGRVGDLDI